MNNEYEKKSPIAILEILVHCRYIEMLMEQNIVYLSCTKVYYKLFSQKFLGETGLPLENKKFKRWNVAC